MKVVVAGASGFIGRRLGEYLGPSCELIGLSRSARIPGGGYTEFRQCDLFSRRDTVNAVDGAEIAFYLVHSMMPNERLTQASFEDLDLLCALNFADACREAGVRRIVYLGGLLPENGALSKHLQSRHEVEEALQASGSELVILRAGLVVGAGGSSFEIVRKLTRRLPWMICPSWTQTRTQPVHIADVMEAFEKSIQEEEIAPGTYDLGVTDPISYIGILQKAASMMHLKRRFLTVPVFSAKLSRRWVSLVTNTPFELVAPLIESLREPMLVRETHRFPLARAPRCLESALDEALEAVPSRVVPRATVVASRKRPPNRVRSIQRMTIPQGKRAMWAAESYLQWLPRALRGLIQVETREEGVAHFVLRPSGICLLQLKYAPEYSTESRALFYVSGGALARGDGRDRFEFRLTHEEGVLLTAVHDFSPRLPWWLYRYTQALFHLRVMNQFARFLRTRTTTHLPPAH